MRVSWYESWRNTVRLRKQKTKPGLTREYQCRKLNDNRQRQDEEARLAQANQLPAAAAASAAALSLSSCI